MFKLNFEYLNPNTGADFLEKQIILQSLAGAGGGGFMVVVLKPDCPDDFDNILERIGDDRPDLASTTHRVMVDQVGIRVVVGEKELNLK